MKKIIKLTESDLTRLINRVINEQVKNIPNPRVPQKQPNDIPKKPIPTTGTSKKPIPAPRPQSPNFIKANLFGDKNRTKIVSNIDITNLVLRGKTLNFKWSYAGSKNDDVGYYDCYESGHKSYMVNLIDGSRGGTMEADYNIKEFWVSDKTKEKLNNYCNTYTSTGSSTDTSDMT